MKLKTVIFAITIFLFMVSCVKNDNSQNLEDVLRSSKIFDKINKNSIQIVNGKMAIEENDITEYWVPQENDIAEALAILESYLKDPEKENDRKEDKEQIIKNIADFDFQVIGISKGNNRLIYLNAFPNSHPQENRENMVFVFDGGWNYWQTEINLTSGEIEYFSINGYA